MVRLAAFRVVFSGFSCIGRRVAYSQDLVKACMHSRSGCFSEADFLA